MVFRSGQSLTLVNPVRVDETVLKPLGNVEHIIRLGDFHGLDDQYYQETYGASLWCQPGQTVYPVDSEDVTVLTSATSLPVPFCRLFIFEHAKFPEAALLHEETGLLVTVDSLQYHVDWSYVSLLTKLFMTVVGLRNGLVIGPPWLKRVTPTTGSLEADFRSLLNLDFKHIVGAHGQLLRNDAKQNVERAVNKVFG